MSNQDDENSSQVEAETTDTVDEPCEPEEPPAQVTFIDGHGYVDDVDADRISQQGFYGTRLDDGRLKLEPVELLHLLERKRVLVAMPSGDTLHAKDIVNQLLPADSTLWVRYLVFRDLRSRGYAVRQGFGGGIGFRVYGRGDQPGTVTAKHLVYLLREGIPISLVDLDRVTETAMAARKNLIFALVDQNGEVNYYRVAQTTLQDRRGEL